MSLRGSLVLIVSTILFLPLSAVQAQEASIRGLVTDSSDGTALVGANVLVFTLDGDRVGAAATNVDGYYQIQNLSTEPRLIRVSYVGYSLHRDTLSLKKGGDTYNVSLVPTEQTLEEVSVKAERGATQRQAGTQTVGAADLERIPTPSPSGDLASYLQTLPGVISVGDRGGQLYIRGGTPSQNMVRVDGIRIMKPFHISGFYSAFPEEVVKSADVHAGGFGAQYMGAISSVIDVSLRKGNLQSYEASASVGSSLSSAHVEGPIRKGTDSFLAVGRYSIIEETAGPLFGRDVPVNFYDMTARYSLQLESASCNVTGMRTYDRGRINSDRNLVLSWTNSALGGRCLFFGDRVGHAVDLSAGISRFQNDAGTFNSPQRSASVRKVFLDLSSEQDIFGAALEYGGRWTVTNYDYNLDEKYTSVNRSAQGGGALRAYASLKWDLGDLLTIAPSIGTHFTVRRLSSPTYEPRLRMSVRPDGTEKQEISLALGKYNQVASGISDEGDAGTVFTIWQPSAGSTPYAQALHGILGYRHEIGSSVEVSVEGYVKDLSNIQMPEWSPVSRFDVTTTTGDGLAYGTDVRTVIDVDPLYLYLGYGWSKITYEVPSEDVRAWWIDENVTEFPPAHDRRHQLSIVASYEMFGFTANANWKLTSGRPYTKVFGFDLAPELPQQYPTTNAGTPFTYYDEPYDGRLPAYHRLDLSIERSLNLSSKISLDLKAGAINTYDRENIFYYSVDSASRVNQTLLLPYFSIKTSIN